MDHCLGMEYFAEEKVSGMGTRCYFAEKGNGIAARCSVAEVVPAQEETDTRPDPSCAAAHVEDLVGGPDLCLLGHTL